MNTVKMKEILFSGYTMQDVADGKLAFTPVGTQLDDLATQQTTKFEESKNTARDLDFEVLAQSVYARAVVENSNQMTTASSVVELKVSPTTTTPTSLGASVCKEVQRQTYNTHTHSTNTHTQHKHTHMLLTTRFHDGRIFRHTSFNDRWTSLEPQQMETKIHHPATSFKMIGCRKMMQRETIMNCLHHL